MSKTPSPPQEDPSVKKLRERQVRELIELDEEENERLKKAFRVSRGARAFSRTPTTGNAADNAQGGRASVPNSGGRASTPRRRGGPATQIP